MLSGFIPPLNSKANPLCTERCAMSGSSWPRRLRLLAIVFVFCCAAFAQEAPGKKASVQTAKAGEFSESVANRIMGDIGDGLEGHSQRLLLSAFDADKMPGYLAFQDQIQAFFDKYETLRVHIRVMQIDFENARGIILSEFEMEGMPRGGGPALRRTGQLRFEVEQGKKGWKIVALRPRAFFS